MDNETASHGLNDQMEIDYGETVKIISIKFGEDLLTE